MSEEKKELPENSTTNKVVIRVILIFLLIIVISILLVEINGNTTNNNTSNSAETTSESNYENPYLMEQLEAAFEEGDYSLVEETANYIIETHPDTVDEIMAESYIQLINSLNADDEQEAANINFKDYIQLVDIKTDAPNSVGGINLYIIWKNTSNKQVKYADFDCELYNAVDDRVHCSIKGNYLFSGRVTGPVEPGTIYGKNTLWENAWWNHSGKYAKIVGIQLEYMDGTEIEIPENRIGELFY